LTASQPNKTATLSTGASIRPFRAVDLHFTGVTSKSVTCFLGSEVRQTGTLAGKIYCSPCGAKSTAWGKIGTGTKPVTFAGKSTLVFGDECVNNTPPQTPRCRSFVYFGSASFPLPPVGLQYFWGQSVTKHVWRLSAGRTLSTIPNGVEMRFDTINQLEPAGVMSPSTQELTINT
jgi:hypothetical protein